jgi:hypothetical protein
VDCVHLSWDRLLKQAVADEESVTLRVFGIYKGRKNSSTSWSSFYCGGGGVMRNNSR